MQIGTDKPSFEVQNGIQHHLIDCVSLESEYSASDFERDALKTLQNIFKKNSSAIITGGSGLYINALCEGLDEIPKVPHHIIESLNELHQNKGYEALLDELKVTDPEYFSVCDKSNSRRVIRALSVARLTGKSYSSYLTGNSKKRPFHIIYILLQRERQDLYNRINQRVDDMVDRGLIEEAKSLYHLKEYKSLQTVGYQEIFSFFNREISLNEAIELVKRNTRRYAKRQLTWFRKETKWTVFHPDDYSDIIRYVVLTLKRYSQV